MELDKAKLKKEGFEGQKAIVLPKLIINKFCVNNPLIAKAFITDIGYYPKAQFHHRKRPFGAEQNILIYCVEGKGEIAINNSPYSIIADDFFVIPKGVPHFYETDLENPWTIYWCHFRGEQTDQIIKLIKEKYSVLKARVPFSESIIKLFENLYSNLEKGYSFENISYVNLIFLQFLSSFIFTDKFNFNFEEDHQNMIEQSIQFMQKNLDKGIKLEELSKHVNSSASHFSAIFKKKTGLPPIEYLNHLKIQKSCQYLQFTDLRIKEIASKIGIDDQYYFSRLFNKTMGFSPSEYREQRKSTK